MRLPVYPDRVTKNKNILVNHPDNRSPENYVKHLLQLPVTDPRYAKRDVTGDGVDETFCNQYVIDALDVMGYSYPWMRAKQLITLWREGQGPMVKMVIQDAVTNANMGCPTIFALDNSGPTWHVGIVLPQPPVVKLQDLIVANVGASNFYGRQLVYGVKRTDVPRVELYGAP